MVKAKTKFVSIRDDVRTKIGGKVAEAIRLLLDHDDYGVRAYVFCMLELGKGLHRMLDRGKVSHRRYV